MDYFSVIQRSYPTEGSTARSAKLDTCDVPVDPSHFLFAATVPSMGRVMIGAEKKEALLPACVWIGFHNLAFIE